jgi:hypothetical protein
MPQFHMSRKPCIGLFGTCGNSTWRTRFINIYDGAGIEYFNPQVDDWKPELADIEAQHLLNDDIILFPVTGETYGFGSLAETGFSIIQAIKANASRFVIVAIFDVDPTLEDAFAMKESARARALVKAHLKTNPQPNVFVVNDLETMLKLSMELYRVCETLNDWRTILGENSDG